jgi:hypothetical protein
MVGVSDGSFDTPWSFAMAATSIARPMKGACSMTIGALRFYGSAISVIAMSRRQFLPLDVAFMEDAKIIEVGQAAAWLYLAMCLSCKRNGTDGQLTYAQVKKLNVRNWVKLVDKLEVSCLVQCMFNAESATKMYSICNWRAWNLTSTEREQVRNMKKTAAQTRWKK